MGAGEIVDERASVLRILDANGNRASEGLRVAEDYARFVLDDRGLSALCKHLRHELSTVMSVVCPTVERLRARDTVSDVGTTISSPQEYRRESSSEVARASLQRCQQALRCLEEYAKTMGEPETAGRFEQLRYRVYSLDKSLAIVAESLSRLAGVRLYVLVDGRGSSEDFQQLIDVLIAAGVHAIQLRDKELDDRQLLERARLLRELTGEPGVLCIVNDRPDIAVLADADGVHVGQQELPARDARRIVGPRRLVGVSTHSIADVRQAVLDGADYIGCGPTFPSQTKAFRHFPGLPFLREVAQETHLPAFAIGGIGVENLPQVLECGISRVAVSRAVSGAPDPADSVRGLLRVLDTSS